ncbi:influenza virus NS1A-binding protein homolog A-like [Copidosoma floridanum]|uniref:influenza virus NS1A-binding protein homolog A-like n=1 Tax=Copidosoma floridanum TaxID=29053 RepID=UPI0006C9C93B|nr:influenza virus NS1A-binding protein homolog A-like [Copidosoma floridanum]
MTDRSLNIIISRYDTYSVAGNAEMHGHKAVLAAASPYLFELFTNGENQLKDQAPTFVLSGSIDKKALQKLIDYAYTSRLEICPLEVKSIYQAATYLKMERVASQCVTYLLDSLTPEFCLDIRALPGIIHNENFVRQVDSYIRHNFEAVCASPALSILPSVKIEILYQTSLEMSLVNGSSLCCLVLDWIKRFVADVDEEKPCVVEQLFEKTFLLYLALDNSLQDCTDLPTGDVSDTDIVQDYKKLSLKSQVQHNKARRKGILQPAKPRVLIYNQSPEEASAEENKQLEPDWNMIGVNKVGEHTFLAIVTLNGRLAKLSVALRLNTPAPLVSQENGSRLPEDQRSSSSEPDLYCALPTMKAGKCSVGCAELNGALLVCGGYDRVECLKSVDKYIPETNTWEVLSAMREARGRFGIAVVNGKVYAIGGSNGSTELATVEVLEPGNNKWKTIASLPLARSNSGVCALGSKIYCIGGWNGQAGIKQCDSLDPTTGIWSSVEPLKIGRYQAGVCAYDNKVYAVGGCDSWNCLNSVEIYDPETNSWSFGPGLITARRGCGLAVFHGRLYAVGGYTGTHSLTSTEVYDPAEQVWVPGPNMCMPRANVAVAVVGDRLYAVGGFSGKKFLNSMEYLDVHTNEWTTFIPKTDGIKTPPNPEINNGSDSVSTNGNEKDPQPNNVSRQSSQFDSKME